MDSVWKYCLMITGEKCYSFEGKSRFPSELANKFDMDLAVLSTHLRALTLASLVTEKREAQTARYTLLSMQNSMKFKHFFARILNNKVDFLKEYIENKNKRTDKIVGSAMK